MPRFRQYARSKLCNILFTAELQRQCGSKGILATSVSPGFVNTGIFKGLPWYAVPPAKLLASFVGRTPAQVGPSCRGLLAVQGHIAVSGLLFFLELFLLLALLQRVVSCTSCYV